MENNICLGCRFGSVRIEVSVPEKLGFKKFTAQTRAFSAKLASSTKNKPIHYTLKFDSSHRSEELDFNIHCQCILNVNQLDCSKFNSAQNCRVKHLQPIKTHRRETELATIRTL